MERLAARRNARPGSLNEPGKGHSDALGISSCVSGTAAAACLPSLLASLSLAVMEGLARASSQGWVGSLWESLCLSGLPFIRVSKSKIPELPQGTAESPN